MVQIRFDEILEKIREQEELIDRISTARDKGEQIARDLNDRLESAHQWAETLLEDIDRIEFVLAEDSANLQEQDFLLRELQELGKKIQRFRHYPGIVNHLRLERAELFVALANTCNDMAGYVIDFTSDEIDQLRVLLRRAALDSAARQRWADVLDGSVQLSKFLYRLGSTLVA